MDAALDQPRFASAITATPAITDAALRALRASDEGRELARSHADLCESEGTCALSWDARGDVERSIKLFATRDGRRWIFAAVRSTGGCGGFVADLTMIAEVRESGGVVSFDEAACTKRNRRIQRRSSSARAAGRARSSGGGRAIDCSSTRRGPLWSSASRFRCSAARADATRVTTAWRELGFARLRRRGRRVGDACTRMRCDRNRGEDGRFGRSPTLATRGLCANVPPCSSRGATARSSRSSRRSDPSRAAAHRRASLAVTLRRFPMAIRSTPPRSARAARRGPAETPRAT